jgi:hypothetical protein
MAPIIDVGTFSIGRMGISGHPVAWAWRKVSTPNVLDEHYALYRVGDPNDGFLRPTANSGNLGYRFVFIPDGANGPYDHVNLAAFKTFVTNACIGCGMDPTKIVHVRADAAGPGQGPAFLGVGFQRLRRTAGSVDPIVAWTQRKTGTNQERWRRANEDPNDPSIGYPKPGTARRNVDLWFTGSLEVETDEFDSIVAAEATTPVGPSEYFHGIPE